MTRFGRYLVAALLLAAGLLAILADRASAFQASSNQSSVEVRVHACLANAPDGTQSPSCQALTGDELILDGLVRQTGTTAGELGSVRFDGLPAGTYTIAEAVPTGVFAGYEVSCTANAGATPIPVEKHGDGRAAVQLTLPANAAVVCEWSNLGAAPTGVTMPGAGSGTAAPAPDRTDAFPVASVVVGGAMLLLLIFGVIGSGPRRRL